MRLLPTRFRPSSLPMLRQCPQFEASGWTGEDDKEAGTDRHACLAWQLNPIGDDPGLDLDQEEKDAIAWARDYIKCHAPSSFNPLYVERKLSLLNNEFDEILIGTPDVWCGGELFDFKWRKRDYGPQLVAYALMIMDETGRDEIRIHVLFGAFQHAEVYVVTRSECWALITEIATTVIRNDPPRPCEYCRWCARRLTCPPLLAAARTVVDRYGPTDQIEHWHPSEMETAEEIGAALRMWRVILKAWGESVEYHALEAATKKGWAIPGFTLTTRKGKSWCPNIAAAFGASGLPQEEFLKACDLRFNTSKTDKAKVGIFDVYAAHNAITKIVAKRELTQKLSDVGALAIGKASQSLRATNTGEEEDANIQ